MLDAARLLQDARLVSAYAGRRGIQIGAELYDAIVAADAKIGANTYGQPEEQNLQRAIGAATRQIRPATVEQLRRQEDLESGNITLGLRLRLAFEIFVQASIFIICFCLIAVIVPLTTYYNQLSAALVEMKTFEDAHYFSQLHDVQVLSGKVESEQQFQEKLRILIEEDGKISLLSISMARYLDIDSGRARWREIFMSFYPIEWAWPAQPAAPAVAAMDAPLPSTSPPGRAPEAAPIPIAPLPSTSPPGRAPEVAPIPIAPLPSTSPPGRAPEVAPIPIAPLPSTSPPGKGSPLAPDIDFAKQLRLSVVEPNQLQGTYIARSVAGAFGLFLGGSILPLMYGFLGASVYLMRTFLGTAAERPGASAFIRLGLGGIAGLAIGWFAGPEAAKATQLTTTPFALAFLAGFSIELLFSVLDRLIAAFAPSETGSAPPHAS
jgi:hypothetical protein